MPKEKIEKLQKQIDKFKQSLKKKPVKVHKNSSLAFNIAIELVAGTIVGVILGLFFDNLFDSKPAFLIICLIVSIMAAFRAIWKKHITHILIQNKDR